VNDVKVSTFDMGTNERMVEFQGEGAGRNNKRRWTRDVNLLKRVLKPNPFSEIDARQPKIFCAVEMTYTTTRNGTVSRKQHRAKLRNEWDCEGDVRPRIKLRE